MKRRNGFTLTEILIALVLVGVLSAVAINTLRSRDMSEEFTAKRDKAIMNIQGVIKNTMFNERIEQLASFDDIKDKVNEHLSARADGDNLFMRDGTMYSINTVSDSSSPYVAELVIDTNGNTMPNSFGLDKYKYKLDLGGNLILDENTDNSNWSGINPPGDIPNGGGADPKLPAINNDENKCPSGTMWNPFMNKCTPILCAVGYELVGNTCEPIKCQEGYKLVGSKCERICLYNQALVNGKCVPKCLEGYSYSTADGICKPNKPQILCLYNQAIENGKCVTKCSRDENYINGACVPREEEKCPNGYIFKNNKCVAQTDLDTLEPDNQNKGGGSLHYYVEEDPLSEGPNDSNPGKDKYDHTGQGPEHFQNNDIDNSSANGVRPSKR